MQVVRLTRPKIPLKVEGLGGRKPTSEDFDLLVQDDATIYKPNGELLLILAKGVLNEENVTRAQNALRDAAKISRNRGMAAGYPDEAPRAHGYRYGAGIREYPILLNGALSKTDYAPAVSSGIVGYLDRNARFPYCRMTAFGLEFPEKFSEAIPLIHEISEEFRYRCETKWLNQWYYIQSGRTLDYRISDTVFSTITVNLNFQTAIHKDKGDYKDGFGVMTVMERGNYGGGYLCFPEFRVAVDVRHRDILFSDVHEWHGNTVFVPRSSDWERLSLVLYFRENMIHCESQEKERERVKRWKTGDGLTD